jgi:hypothetical protein
LRALDRDSITSHEESCLWRGIRKSSYEVRVTFRQRRKECRLMPRLLRLLNSSERRDRLLFVGRERLTDSLSPRLHSTLECNWLSDDVRLDDIVIVV